jgi:hypothetical protein
LQATLTDLRTRFGLFARADLDRWMALNELDAASLERLIGDETYLKDLRNRSRVAIEPFLLDELRLSGAYERLAERARKKREALAALKAGTPGAPSGSLIVALRLWYFEQRRRLALPDDVEDFARRLGFAHAADFDAAVLRERLYLDAQGGDQSA